jgi:hypothetical protein
VTTIVSLHAAEAAHIAAFLARVVPRGPAEADELERLVQRLSTPGLAVFPLH